MPDALQVRRALPVPAGHRSYVEKNLRCNQVLQKILLQKLSIVKSYLGKSICFLILLALVFFCVCALFRTHLSLMRRDTASDLRNQAISFVVGLDSSGYRP